MEFQSHIINEVNPLGLYCCTRDEGITTFCVALKVATLITVTNDEKGNFTYNSKPILRFFNGEPKLNYDMAVISPDFINFDFGDSFLCLQGKADFNTIWKAAAYCNDMNCPMDLPCIILCLRQAGMVIDLDDFPQNLNFKMETEEFFKGIPIITLYDYVNKLSFVLTDNDDRLPTFIQLHRMMREWESYYYLNGKSIQFSFDYSSNDTCKKCVVRANSMKGMSWDDTQALAEAIELARKIGKDRQALVNDLMDGKDSNVILLYKDEILKKGYISIDNDGLMTVNDSLAFYMDYDN